MPDTKPLIADLKQGDQVDGSIFQLRQVVMRQTQQGQAFALGELQDRSGTIGFVWWHISEQAKKQLTEATYAKVSGRVDMHRDRLQLVVKQARPVPADQINPKDFIPQGPVDLDATWDTLLSIIDAVEDVWIRRLLKSIIIEDADLSARFKEAPAGVSMHHAYRHGLLAHSVSVAHLASDMAARYPELDRSLLIAGALLHDFCKVLEIRFDDQVGYTTEGNLIGHLVMGAMLVDRVASGIDGFPQRTKEKVQHLILSHHGEMQHGAAREPMVIEAVVLHLIDNIDSRVAGYKEAVNKSASTDPDWTEPMKIFGRRMYRGP